MLLRTYLFCCFVLIGLFSAAQSNGDSLEYKVYYYEKGKGAKSSEGYLRKGKPDGFWKSFYRNGNLKSTGNRKNYKLDSIWTFYNEDGIKTFEISYVNGIKSGFTKAYKEGVLFKKDPYVDGKIHGFSEYYYASGSLKKEVPHTEGVKLGTGYVYAEDDQRIIILHTYKEGSLVRKQNVNRKDGQEQKQGMWMSFHKNRQIASEGPYVNDLKNGYWKFYKPNGNLLRVEKWIMGELQQNAQETEKIEIRSVLNPKTGKLASKGAFRNNVAVGVHRKYDAEGNVIESKIYEDGIVLYEGIVDEQGRKQGPWKMFYPTGELKAKGAYKDDLKIKEWSYFFSNGKVEQVGSYLRGLPDGMWTWYHENEEVWREEEYVMGEEDGLSIEYNDSGKVIAKGNYVEGFKEGSWFYQINDHREEGAYFEGELTGKWKHYYLSNGNLRFEGFYEGGIKNGNFAFYYPNGQIKRRGDYVNNERHGVWEFFREDGARIITIEYNNGEEIKYNGEKIKYSRAYQKELELKKRREAIEKSETESE